MNEANCLKKNSSANTWKTLFFSFGHNEKNVIHVLKEHAVLGDITILTTATWNI